MNTKWILQKGLKKSDQEERAEPIEQFAVEVKNNLSFKENGQ